MLANMPYELAPAHKGSYQMQGINWTDNYGDGALQDSKDLSVRRFPYYATGDSDVKVDGFPALWTDAIESVYAWNHLFLVVPYPNDQKWLVMADPDYPSVASSMVAIMQVSSGTHQFAVLRNKLIIFPEKKYFDFSDTQGQRVFDLEATTTTTNKTVTTETIDGIPYCVLSGFNPSYLSTHFKADDVVNISGFTESRYAPNINNGYHKIVKVETINGKLYFPADTMQTGTDSQATTITVKREIPDMDFVCAADNRLWGCSSAKQEIYASRMGDPTNFFDFSGEADDSFAAGVVSPGNFTGAIQLGSSVCFFKEQKVHKVLGSFAAEYQINSYDVNGVAEGCSETMCIINNVLYYVGIDGVYAYNGGNSYMISGALGSTFVLHKVQTSDYIDNCVAGTDGVAYYLSFGIPYEVQVSEHSSRIEWEYYNFSYYPQYGIWLRDGDLNITQYASVKRHMYYLSGGNLYKKGEFPSHARFVMQFKPFYDDNAGELRKKRHEDMIVRVDMQPGKYPSKFNTTAKFEISEDGGPWKTVATLENKTGLQRIMLPISRVDKYELRITGYGDFTLLGLERVYRVGSDK